MGATMKQCGGCERHLLGAESRCPFCGTALPMVDSGLARCGRAIMVGLTIVLGSVGCDPGTLDTGTGMSEQGDDSGSDEVSSEASAEGTSTSTGSTSMMATEGEAGSDSASADGPEDSADSAGSFYAGVPDGGGGLIECDIFAQDCPEGEKCMPWASDGGNYWTDTRCSPVADSPGQPLDPCTVEGSGVSGIDDCDIAAMCFGVDPATNEGHCVAMCTGDASNPICEDPDTGCFEEPEAGLHLCLPKCDPVMQDCAEGEGCFPNGDQFYCLDSGAPGSAHGDPCTTGAECAPGQLCLEAASFSACAGASCCTTYCSIEDPGASAACAALDGAQECVPWYDGGAPPGLEPVGACAIP